MDHEEQNAILVIIYGIFHHTWRMGNYSLSRKATDQNKKIIQRRY
jgi:hypothetical protein